MSEAEKYFNQLSEEIPGIKPGKMFGALCLKTPNGKSAAMMWKDSVVVKTDEKQRDEMLGLKGASLFEPMAGKPMKDWVQVPFEHKKKWKQYILQSIEQVKDIPAKKKKTKK